MEEILFLYASIHFQPNSGFLKAGLGLVMTTSFENLTTACQKQAPASKNSSQDLEMPGYLDCFEAGSAHTKQTWHGSMKGW